MAERKKKEVDSKELVNNVIKVYVFLFKFEKLKIYE